MGRRPRLRMAYGGGTIPGEVAQLRLLSRRAIVLLWCRLSLTRLDGLRLATSMAWHRERPNLQAETRLLRIGNKIKSETK